MRNRKSLVLFCLLLFVALVGMILSYAFVTNRLQGHLLSKGPRIGVVRMDDVIRLNPAYEDYEQANRELEALKAQYGVEQSQLNTKAFMQAEALKNLSMDEGQTEAYNNEIKAKIKRKEDEMNAQLDAKRQELMAKYIAEAKVNPTDTDLEIVNLQLQLLTYNRQLPFDEGEREKFQAKKEEIQSRLQDLLAKRGPNISGNLADVQARVEADLKPMIEQGQKDLEAYAKSVQKETSSRRDSELQAKAKSIMEATSLPNAAEWNQNWQERLDDKQAQVDALYEAMEDDVRMRAAVIAQSQGLDLILKLDEGETNVTGLDITDAVVASYGAN